MTKAAYIIDSIVSEGRTTMPGALFFMPGILPPDGFYAYGATLEEAVSAFLVSLNRVYGGIGDVNPDDWQAAFTTLLNQYDLVAVFNDAGDIIVYNTQRDAKLARQSQSKLTHVFKISRMTPVTWFSGLEDSPVEIDAGRAFFGKPSKALPKKIKEPVSKKKAPSEGGRLHSVKLSDEEKRSLLGGSGNIDSLGS